MKKCDIIETEKLSAYVDGELNDKEMQEVANHLKDCEACKLLVEELEELSSNTLFHYEKIENSFELPNLIKDLNEKLKNTEDITEEHTLYDNIIEFPKEKIKTKETKANDNIFGKIYKFAPAIVSLAAILLISIIISNNKPNTTTANTQAKASDSVTVDSLEYSKFNAMIYKTKDKNKTVIWLFKENSDNDDDGPI